MPARVFETYWTSRRGVEALDYSLRASFLAGAAQGGTALIAARAIQGFGAALTAPAALSLIAVTFPEGRERNRALGIFGAVGGVAGSVGVVAGGLLTFVYALHHAAGHGWISATTLALFAVAAVLLVAFVRIEARCAAPLLPLPTLRNRRLVGAYVTAFVVSCAFLSFIFIGSLLMQQGLGYSPVMTGLAWLATTAVLFVAAMAGGRLAARVGGRRLLIVGLSLFTAGALWMIRVPADGDYVTDLAGIGFGLVEPALQIGALTGVSESDAGLASGLVETMREIGGAAGVAAVSTVLVAGATLDVFHTAFAIIAGLAVLGVVVATVGFARRS